MIKEDAEKQIKEAFPYRLELHAHTSPASRCSQVSPGDVITIFHNAGYDGIAVAECDWNWDTFAADMERLNRCAVRD